jgi:hypothetical protein
VLACLAAAPPAQARPWSPRPILNENFADPSVVSTPDGLVAYSTGDLTPKAWSRTERGRWVRDGETFTELPSWASTGAIWAVDVAQVQGRWVMYYAAPVDGIVRYGRCIGVAVSDSPRGGFVNVSDAPLVCPSYAATPPAEDQLPPGDPNLPRAGVIDPSFFLDTDGQPYLVYKTDRVPSTIRVVALTPDGFHVNPGAVSVEMVRDDGVIENPVLTHRPEGYVLLVSHGDWTRCAYSTRWLRSPSLLDWSVRETGVLLSQRTTGLCGPGGADLVDVHGATQQRLFLHGWTCRRRPLPCAGWARKWDRQPRRVHAVRAFYALRLSWPGGLPQVAGWIRPR